MNAIFTARSGYPFTVFDCTNGMFFCMRAIDPSSIDKSATSGAATGNPNEFELLDLTPLLATAGSYVNPLTGNSDFGPYPADMTERNAFRGPGAWNIDFIVGKRFRFGTARRRWFASRCTTCSTTTTCTCTATRPTSAARAITGFLDDNRRMQLGFKFEF